MTPESSVGNKRTAGLRVLLIHQAFATPNEGGGTRHYEFARHAVERGVNFTVVASDVSYLTGRNTMGGRGLVIEQRIDGIRVVRARMMKTLHTSFAWRVMAFISFMVSSFAAGCRAGRCDIVMGTTPPMFQAVSAWALAALRRRPFLLEVRDLWPEFAIDMGVLRNPLLIRLARALERFLYAHAQHILVNSPAYRKYLVKHGVDHAKIAFIPNGVDPALFDPDDTGAETRRTLGLEGRFVVTYAGALGQANDIGTILRAAERVQDVPRVHFLLVGDGKERRNLEAQAAARGVRNVTFVGARAKADIAGILAASDACIATLQPIPMFTTTYPNKVFDYMAAGRPTVLAIDGVIREVVEAARGGIFVPPGNDGRIAEVVCAWAANPEDARRMGRHAREYVARHFNRRDHAELFLNLLNTLAPLTRTRRG